MLLKSRGAWLCLVAVVGLGVSLGQGCSGDTTQDDNRKGTCGNEIREASEECDDGNTIDTDDCRNDCTNNDATCGDGVVEAPEQCDDGNVFDDDGCSNTCMSSGGGLCGNGVIDDDEDCDDDGQNTANCNADCTSPFCGDGIVNQAAGETCEPGGEFECINCGQGGGGGNGQGGCGNQAVFSNLVTNNVNPLMPGGGIASDWAYGGQLGINAGNDMCAAIGADHVCTYDELLDAEAAGELSGIAQDQEIWVHRVAITVACKNGTCNMGSGMSPPGAGARCNEWTYSTNHISDGEFAVMDPNGVAPTQGTKIGSMIFYMDDDAQYTANAGDNHQCNGVNFHNDPAGAALPGCAGGCGSASPKAIPCCFPTCQ
jgi:cysteine-rich repeat protein